MSANFQYLVPQTTLTASGLSQNFGIMRWLSLTFVNLSSSVSVVVTLTDENGRAQVYTVGAGLSFGPTVMPIRQWSFAGTGAVVAAIFTSEETLVPVETLRSMLVSVTGTVNTDVGQGTATNSQVVLTEPLGTTYDARARTWNLDDSDAQGTYFTGGAAPISGVWTLTVAGTGETPTINSLTVGSALSVDAMETTTLAVKAGVVYTVSGCTVLDGWVSVG